MPGRRPELVENCRVTHAEALDSLAARTPAVKTLSIATGYLNLPGLRHLAGLTRDGRASRLLFGAEATLGAARPSEVFEKNREKLDIARNFAAFPPSRNAAELAGIQQWLARPDTEVRLHRKRFLHGKAYLFEDESALVTSANLTAAGLLKNLELGLVHYQPGVAKQALAWFDRLWEDSTDWKQELLDLLSASPLHITDPQTVFLRTLLELYGEEAADGPRPTKVDLADFQLEGYRRALRILREHHGCIFADGVGTGKTEIGLAIIEEYALRRGQRALVVAPAQLVGMWNDRIKKAGLPAEIVSYHQLAADEQLARKNTPNRSRHLRNDKEAFRLVVADEGHSFRNPDTTWYRALSRLMGGEQKDLLLLTATPINNGLLDLYHLVSAFARHDRAFAKHQIGSLRGLFERAGAHRRALEDANPDALFPLADLVSVRRDRRFIEQRYPDAVFPDGTPVRFPKPELTTERYDLDAAAPGLVADITGAIEALTMARYRPGAYRVEGGTEPSREAALAGLLRSLVLKRFESCWKACRLTVERMEWAHGVAIEAWATGFVATGEQLQAAARADLEDTGLAEFFNEQFEDAEQVPASDFEPRYAEDLNKDRNLLRHILYRLSSLNSNEDPKIALLTRLIKESPSQKVIVFSGFADTIRYLDEHLPPIPGKERIAVIGAENDPDERTRMLSRFCPKSVIGQDHEPPDGEVDLLLSNDVLSEGQNLQQAAAVISYDMPWNPQRVVQRYGRVIRLKSEHNRVHLTTMLPVPGELEDILNLEATILRKMAAADLYGMDAPVVEGAAGEMRTFADRLAAGDLALLEVDGGGDPAAVLGGEEMRAQLARWIRQEGEKKLRRLVWGAGAVFRQGPGVPAQGDPGVFFAFRTRSGDRYWRHVRGDGATRPEPDAAILRRIVPGDAPGLEEPRADLEIAWRAAAASVVREHNALADAGSGDESLGPKQAWALDLLRDPDVPLPEKTGEDAAVALAVGRGAIVRRALGDIRRCVESKEISRAEAARRVVELVQQEGLRPVDPPDPVERITERDLGVVCWIEVLAADSE